MFKKIAVILFALVNILYTINGLTATAATQSPELIVNQGFENGTTSWSGQYATLTVVTSNFNSGASALKISNRSYDYSTALQNVVTGLKSYGAGNYKLTAYVKLAAPLASGTCRPMLVIKYNDGTDHYATTSRVAINDQNYVKIEGSLNLSWSGTLNSAQMYVQTGTGGKECLSDLYVDDFSLVNTDRSTPINQSPELLVNTGFESGLSNWNGQYATLSVDSLNANSGASALKISNRSQDWGTAYQNVDDVLNSYGPGNYKLSAYAKLAAPLVSGSCSPMVVIKYNDGSDHYASTSRVAINNQNYIKLEGNLNLSWVGMLSSAQLYVQTGTGGKDCLSDLFIDDFSLVNTDRATPLPPYLGDSSVNLAANKGVTASNTLNNLYNTSYVTDGDITTLNGHEWAADVSQNAQWVTVDLQNSVKFNRIEFYTSKGKELKDYQIQYWTSTGWVNIFPGVTGNAADHNTYVFEPLISSKIRVNVTKGDAENIARLVEIGVYLDPNLALGKSVVASSVQTGYSASYINDGNKVTSGWKHWAADVSNGPQWVEIDLGAMTTFQRVEFYTPSSYEQREYTIQYWDGSQWVAAFPTVTGNSAEHNSHSFNPVTASKLRVYVTEGNIQQHGLNGGENVARIVELEVYRSGGRFVDNNVVPDPIPQTIDQRQDKTVVGAIRWDMWGGTDNPLDIGSQTQKTLSPEKYHFRLPWYASVTGTNEAHIPQYTQEIMDQEIHYAKKAGIDYWAFVMYESPTARDLYLSSTYKNDVKWTAILGASGYSFDNYPWLVSQFKTSNYQKVLNDRPLVYVWNTNKRYVDELRSEARKQGIAEPYIVIMGTNAKTMRQMQGDALSQYTNFGANGSPYSTLIQNDQTNWNLLADYGAQVIPTVTTGWDPRPRIDTPVWTSYGANQWAQTATASEIAVNLKNALDWNDTHRSSSFPNAVLMYAWNENDEGGWIIPTLGADGKPDTSRLDAIQSVLRPDLTPPTTTAALTPDQPDGSDGWYVHPVSVSLTATDDSSGVAKTEYSLDGGSTWQSYAAPVMLNQDDNYTVSYRSTDNARNVEAVKTIGFNLDQTGPTMIISGLVDDAYSDSANITPSVAFSDNLSGVDSSKTTVTLSTYGVQQTIQQGATLPLYTLPLGSHTFIVTASDMAGNTGSQTVVFQTTTSIPSIKALVTRFTNMGWVDNEGIANSLQSKLNTSDLDGFISHVKAQSGKHISSQAAGYLLRDAQYLLSNLQ
ncbi:discoidin domain-containing protein [Paenibacillus oryzisoli]|uniref:OmpL47-type beta-barrel domain-containing protein n=1 Tax=Paenibacillus oryzisoli TaxID=1850517 RepID=UPI003D291EFC